MKVGLHYQDNYYFEIEPETVIEKCAFEYLRDRPKITLEIDVIGLGRFIPLDTDLYTKARCDYINECQKKRALKEDKYGRETDN